MALNIIQNSLINGIKLRKSLWNCEGTIVQLSMLNVVANI